MIGFKECMDRAVAGGEMSKERAEGAKKAYDFYVNDVTPEEAQARVVHDASEVARQNKKRLESNARAQKVIEAKIDAGLPLSKIVEDFSHKGSLRFRHEAIRAELRAEMNDVLQKFSSNLIGQRRNKATLQNMVRERYGQKTSDPAAADLSKSFTAAQSKAKKLYEDAGGFVRTKANHGLPQSHSQTRVGKTDPGEWADFVMARIDRSNLTDDLGNVLPDAAARDALIRMHEDIASGGWASKSKTKNGGAYKLGERRIDPDYLPFRDGDAWLQYAEAFGEQTDPWRVMVGYIDSMSHQIAEVEVLGVDANATWKFATDRYMEKNRGSDSAKRNASFANNMRDTWSGVTQEPESRAWARSMSNVRQYLASVQLGSAFISSVSDFSTSSAAAGFAGLSRTGHLGMVKNLVKSRDFRDAARENGLILENAIDMGTAAFRYSMEDFTTEGAARLSDFTMRSSLLSGWTQLSRDATGMAAQNDFAKMRKTPFSKLPEPTQRLLAGFDIQSADWNKMRKAEVSTTNGVEFLRPKDVEATAGRQAALGYMEMINALQNRGTLTSSIQSQAAVRGSTRPGSLSGEALRTIAQYKTFPIEFILRPIGQVFEELSNARYRGAMQQAAILFIGTTVLGGVALQLKEITKGRNPKDMDGLDFWKAAALQGGGLGIFGDFLLADHNRFGQSIGQSIAGPTVGLGSDALKLTVGNVSEVIQGKDTNFGREAAKFATDYTPAQSLWYARVAFERLVEDNLMRLVDPDAQRRFNSKTRKSQKDANGYWWQPGQAVPQ